LGLLETIVIGSIFHPRAQSHTPAIAPEVSLVTILYPSPPYLAFTFSFEEFVFVSTQTELLNAPPVPVSGPIFGNAATSKLLHLQILRALAAALVVVDHSIGLGIGQYGADPRFRHAADLIGSIGVSAFFVLSGVIMVQQSRDLFRRPGSTLIFAWRRITRIVPLYWVATLFTFILMLFWSGRPQHLRLQLLLSLAFIPDYLSNEQNVLAPITGVGWTLNYEMFFYLLFALALRLPRRVGLLALIVVLELLAAMGQLPGNPVPHTAGMLLRFYTSSQLRLFDYGVLIGFFQLEAFHVRSLRLPFSPAFLLLLCPMLLLLFPSTLGEANLYGLLGVVSALVVLTCSLAGYQYPGRMGRILVLLGDASYSTYLFHLTLVYVLLMIGRAFFLHGRQASHLYVFVMTAFCVVAANLLGLAIHLSLERPLIRVYRRLSASSVRL
jgi:exopolysaccharide production protein ExoZ